MGGCTRGKVKGKLWVAEVKDVVCMLQGWVVRLKSEVSKGVRDDWCLPSRELYYFEKNLSRERVRR